MSFLYCQGGNYHFSAFFAITEIGLEINRFVYESRYEKQVYHACMFFTLMWNAFFWFQLVPIKRLGMLAWRRYRSLNSFLFVVTYYQRSTFHIDQILARYANNYTSQWFLCFGKFFRNLWYSKYASPLKKLSPWTNNTRTTIFQLCIVWKLTACRENKEGDVAIKRGVCKTRNPPGTCRNLPEPPGTHPEPSRNLPEPHGLFLEPPRTPRNLPGTIRNLERQSK